MSETELVVINALESVELTPEVINSKEFGEDYKRFIDLYNKMGEIKKNIENGIRGVLQDQYLKTGDGKINNGSYSYSYIPGSQRETVDSAKLKADFPEVYKACVKVSPIKESVRINRVDNTITNKED